jgi:uncharacterized protein YgiM (DUF1202 family)
MPQSVVIGLLVLGAVLLLIAVTGGNFKIFVAEVDSPVSNTPVRLLSGILGLGFIAGALILNRTAAPVSAPAAASSTAGSSAPAAPPASGSGSPGSGQASAAGSGGSPSGANPAVSSSEYAIVFDPPTNVRSEATTSSDVLCSVTARTTIRILGAEGKWYRTDVCGNGQVGYIYSNQVKF